MSILNRNYPHTHTPEQNKTHTNTIDDGSSKCTTSFQILVFPFRFNLIIEKQNIFNFLRQVDINASVSSTTQCTVKCLLSFWWVSFRQEHLNHHRMNKFKRSLKFRMFHFWKSTKTYKLIRTDEFCRLHICVSICRVHKMCCAYWTMDLSLQMLYTFWCAFIFSNINILIVVIWIVKKQGQTDIGHSKNVWMWCPYHCEQRVRALLVLVCVGS